MTFHSLRLTTLLTSLSIIVLVLKLSSCRSFSALEQKQPTSSLQSAYDNTYSLVLQKHGTDLRFVTCLGTPQSLNASSCVPALKFQDDSVINYNFLPQSTLKPEDTEQIETLKVKIAEEYRNEHGKLPKNFHILTAGIGSAALGGWIAKGQKAVATHQSAHIQKVTQLLKQDKVLLAKLTFADLFHHDAFTGNEHLELLDMFDDPKRLNQLKTQTSQAWNLLKKRARLLVGTNRDVSGIIKEMTQFHDDVTFWQIIDMSELSADYYNVMDDITPPSIKQRLVNMSNGARTAKDQIRYNVKARQNKTLKHLAATGGYDKAVKMWEKVSDWMVDTSDSISYEKDLLPFKMESSSLQRLKVQRDRLHQLALDKIRSGENVQSLLGSKGSLREVIRKLGTHLDTESSRMFAALETQALNKGLLNFPTTAVRTDRAARSLLINTATSVAPQQNTSLVSKSSKYISSKGPFSMTKFLGWGVSLIGGAMVLFAIVDSAESKTIVNLESLNKETQNSSVPFIPVSVYESYWPSLNTLDTNVTLKVPSIPSVLKTLALHASGGNVVLATDMSYCLPALQTGSANTNDSHPSSCYQVTAIE
ncbi:MAG: hypothetical protein OXC44_00745 [Proteobacteria bacterium]|nr:hypothetical protein [Pseudomonadota bacterium]